MRLLPSNRRKIIVVLLDFIFYIHIQIFKSNFSISILVLNQKVYRANGIVAAKLIIQMKMPNNKKLKIIILFFATHPPSKKQ